jgi:hypothetical protein
VRSSLESDRRLSSFFDSYTAPKAATNKPLS